MNQQSLIDHISVTMQIQLNRKSIETALQQRNKTKTLIS